MRLTKTFQDLAARGEKALVVYLTAGDPEAATGLEACRAALRGGADILELGIPFSDPTADGPAIQRASERALRAGMSVAGAIEICRKLRADFPQPIVLFGYYNPLLAFGPQAVAAAAAAAGADGFLVVDLPPEEAEELAAPARRSGLHLIYLLAPTSTDARVARVRERASGFVYYVSRTGVTGLKLDSVDEVRQGVQRLKASLDLPVCVGFGISTAEEARAIAQVADGVVVGSAFVRLCERHAGAPGELARAVESLARELKAATRR